MAERRVSVKFSAEVAGFVRAMSEAAGATRKTKQAAEEAGKATEQSSQRTRTAADVEAAAAQRAAKALGLHYEASGRLVDANGKALTSSQAAALGMEGFSDAVYVAGREAEEAAEKTKQAAEEAAKAAERQKEAWAAVGPVMAAAGAATLAGVGLAVKTYADFDKAMASVQAATHESAANMDLLREAAIVAGADTAFSSEEAAQAIEEMAKAGVSTTDILNGGLNGALSLAAAGSLGVGEAAETAASAMTQFKLSGEDIPHIADLLAAGAGKAQGSVHDLGMALNQAGLVASQTGLTIEEATGGLAAFASAGLVGSDAGTSFKTMLQRLNPQSEAAATLMDELGLSAYDANGEFIGLAEYAGNLQTALQGMSSEQRNAAMQTLFGSDAVRAAAVLYEQGAEGVQQWVDAVNDAGYAAETAAIMQDNLAGDLEKLGGSIDTVFLKSGSGANDALRGLVQTAEDFVDVIGQIPAPVLSAVAGIAAVAGGAAVAAGGFVTLAPRVFETIGHFKELRDTSPATVTALGRIGKAAGVAALALTGLQIIGAVGNSLGSGAKSADELAQAFIRAANNGKDLDEVINNGMFENANNFLTLSGDIDSVGDALLRVQNRNFGDTVNDMFKGVSGYKSEIHEVEESLVNMDTAIAGFASSGNMERAADSFRMVAASAKEQGVGLDQVAESFPQYLDHLRDLANNAGVALEDQELLNWAMGETPPAMVAAAAASDETAAAIGEVGGEAEAAALSLEDIVEALFTLGTIAMSSRDSTAAFHEAIRTMDETIAAAAEGTLGLGNVLNEAATDFDLTTEAGAAANAAFQSLAQAGMTDVEAKAREGLGQEELQANLQTTYDSLIRAAEGMGITGGNAEALAREVLGVPDNVDIQSWMSDAALKMAQGTNSELDKLDGKHVNTYLTIHEHTNRTARDIDTDTSDQGYSQNGGVGGLASGGRVASLLGFDGGGRIPAPRPANMATDNVLGLVNGKPIGLQGQEWVINGASSNRYDKELAAINAGVFPKLPGYAGGGRPGREYAAVGSAASAAGASGMTLNMPITINGATDVNAVRQAVTGDITFLLQKNGVRLGR